MKKLRIAVVLGTRPEIIKMSPLIRLLAGQKHKHRMLLMHTGQHFSYEMDKVFFRDLELPVPTHHFVRPKNAHGSHSEETARILASLEMAFIKEKPHVVLIQGDTNTVLAGALAASKIHGIKIGHVEAGLRSFDRNMPEEINRIITDHISHYLFAPTPLAKQLLLKEGVSTGKIFVTGNTIVDAVRQNLVIAKKRGLARHGFKTETERFMLMTLHRQENVDHKDRLAALLKGIDLVGKKFGRTIIFPVHPRTVSRLKQFFLRLPDCVKPVPPVGFLDFLMLESRAELLLSDSGGVQEEGCILGVPCVTLRTSTERPETVKVGANRIAGYSPKHILNCAEKMMERKRLWTNPFGDGRSSERILSILEDKLA